MIISLAVLFIRCCGRRWLELFACWWNGEWEQMSETCACVGCDVTGRRQRHVVRATSNQSYRTSDRPFQSVWQITDRQCVTGGLKIRYPHVGPKWGQCCDCCGQNYGRYSDWRSHALNIWLLFNSLEYRCNSSATSNDMKLVHWPLMGGLLHLVQRGGDWAGPQRAQAPPRCTKCNSPPINGQCANHRICCIMVRGAVRF